MTHTTRVGDIEILEEEYHRNGICGACFYLTMFRWRDSDGKDRMMLATRFGPRATKEVGAVTTAVLDLGLLRDGCVEFTKNSWRGDQFEDALQKAGSRPWGEDA
jgi:hypothetical protein